MDEILKSLNNDDDNNNPFITSPGGIGGLDTPDFTASASDFMSGLDTAFATTDTNAPSLSSPGLADLLDSGTLGSVTLGEEDRGNDNLSPDKSASSNGEAQGSKKNLAHMSRSPTKNAVPPTSASITPLPSMPEEAGIDPAVLKQLQMNSNVAGTVMGISEAELNDFQQRRRNLPDSMPATPTIEALPSTPGFLPGRTPGSTPIPTSVATPTSALTLQDATTSALPNGIGKMMSPGIDFGSNFQDSSMRESSSYSRMNGLIDRTTPLIKKKRETRTTSPRTTSPRTQQRRRTRGKQAALQAKLKDTATNIVIDSWKNCSTAEEFVALVRTKLPSEGDSKKDKSKALSPRGMNGTMSPGDRVESPGNRQAVPPTIDDLDSLLQLPHWKLNSEAEAALLDALVLRAAASEAASTRIISYLKHAVVAGIVSQCSLLTAIIKMISLSGATASSKAEVPRKVRLPLAQLVYDLLPNYSFSKHGALFDEECKMYLEGVALSLLLPNFYFPDRVIAVARACRRRKPDHWKVVEDQMKVVESNSPSSSTRNVLRRLREGVRASATDLKTIADSVRNMHILPERTDIGKVIAENIIPITRGVFGRGVADALGQLWSEKVRRGGDHSLLQALREAAAHDGHVPPASHYPFHDRIRACEAIVRHLYERSLEVTMNKHVWDSNERLKRLLRESLPQIQKEIESEFSGLVIATAVIGAVIMCVSPRLVAQKKHAEDTHLAINDIYTYADKRKAEVSAIVAEVIAYAVDILEEAAGLEEVPHWKGFGAWLLLLASRCEDLLQLGRCDHLRVTKVLRSWSRWSGPKNTSTVGAEAANISVCVTDASDEDGSEATVYSLCSELVS